MAQGELCADSGSQGGPMIDLCQCDVVPDRPCPAEITQEDLLCDACRTARDPEMIHTVSSFIGRDESVIVRSHGTIDAAAFGAGIEAWAS